MSVDIVFDLELSGPSLGKNFIASIGAIARDSIQQREIGSLFLACGPRSENETKPREFADDCLNQFWRKHQSVAQELIRLQAGVGLTMEEAATRLIQWIDSTTEQIDPRRITFVVDSSADICWLNYYLDKVDHSPLHIYSMFNGLPFYKDILLVPSWATGVASNSIQDRNSGITGPYMNYSALMAARQALSIPIHIQPEAKHTHNPVDDARRTSQQVSIIERYL